MDSVNKYGSDGVPFTGEIAEIKPIEEQLQQVIDALAPVIQSIIDALVPLVEAYIDKAAELWDEVLKAYPDKRVVHLAFYSKSERVRKKNRKRIAQYITKAVKCDDRSW